MSDTVTKVFEHIDFAIWHVPQANGYVYEAAGVEITADNYHDCPFEDSYDDALNAACELYDVEIGALSTPLPVAYSNVLFSVYKTPGDRYLFAFSDDAELVPLTDKNWQDHPGEHYDSREQAVIAAFEKDLEGRGL
ncbi:hypothetical protein [Zoogloea sp.]|uniref:hypothetical protein n=1 Tax=Zoogloea sp. TaxID=49181 RepID=UPI001416600A|nr:MAG: hypothetical protein F9K15_08420 [Zoogloea sp.]